MVAFSFGELSLLLATLVAGLWWFYRRTQNAHEARALIEHQRELDRLTPGIPGDVESLRQASIRDTAS